MQIAVSKRMLDAAKRVQRAQKAAIESRGSIGASAAWNELSSATHALAWLTVDAIEAEVIDAMTSEKQEPTR